MFTRLLLGSSLLIAVVSLLLSQMAVKPSTQYTPSAIGRNNTVLFIVNCEFGLSNVHLATAHALLERHPEIRMHVASFPPTLPRLDSISKHVRKTNSSAEDIVFHELPEQYDFAKAMVISGRTPMSITRPPGRAHIDETGKDMAFFTAPWSGEAHLELFQQLTEIIDEVDPSLVLLDMFFRPGLDAARNRKRLHAFIVPNIPIDVFPLHQPYLKWLWKYPVLGSGILYPVPWSRVLENIYINVRYFYFLGSMHHFKSAKKLLQQKGINRITYNDLHRSNVPFFIQSLAEATIPLDHVPPNVTYTGPISLSLSTLEEVNPELNQWLAKTSTLFVNLGSFFAWDKVRASAMAQAIADILHERTDLQILWKFSKTGKQFGDEFLDPVRPFLKNGRLEMISWLPVEPTTLFETGHIVASVHHGGAGGFHEALGTGIPQIILPQWTDHYSLAQQAQYLGVGVWACQETAPSFTAECLHDSFSTVLGSGKIAESLREKAKQIGEIAQRDPGRYISAREVAKLAAHGA
ncbi:glycosyltransferase family 1 protein [Annulohypoxylon maeteangense]|uniref:glycosyltransferase family 1 protein n=1 Tax=Annulohypoxylon maeteangense TaxID=1927788 RepID=UPI002007D31D|nr:glycosyltransferase family 1 protein [Annulohypoxylon maeteangense]KAI0887490.1 glycosyltransferase family 1 protein [Annulohypoxylon maeteangense]